MLSASPSTSFSCSSEDVGYGQEQLVILHGKLTFHTASEAFRSLQRVAETSKAKIVRFNLEHITSLDDYGIAVLAGISQLLKGRQKSVSLQNVPQDLRALLDYHHFDKLDKQSSLERRAKMPNVFVSLGDAILQVGKDSLYLLSFLGSSTIHLLQVIRNPRALRWEDVITYMQRTGVDALPIVGLISFLLGLIMAFMSSVQLQQFGANIYVASLVSLSMTRELGPIMTCIIVAGRSGSAFAAEIGSMKIAEEVDALFTMGFDPHLFLVTPKLLAAMLVVPMLTLFSDVFAIFGGMLIGVSMLDLTFTSYINQTIATLSLFDVFWGVGKSIIFALLISWIGCLRGFQVRGGAASVGKATTSAVVSAIFLIILTDSIFAVILRYWG